MQRWQKFSLVGTVIALLVCLASFVPLAQSVSSTIYQMLMLNSLPSGASLDSTIKQVLCVDPITHSPIACGSNSVITNTNINNTLNPMNPLYGAKGDALICNGDAAITATSANLACATSTPFTSSHVGKTIIVYGAGDPGAGWNGGAGDLITTIKTFTNSGHVVLNANAGTTVSANLAAFGTDDATAFASTLTALAAHSLAFITTSASSATAGQSAMKVPPGAYIIGSPLTLVALQTTLDFSGSVIYFTGTGVFLTIGQGSRDVSVDNLFLWGSHAATGGVFADRAARTYLYGPQIFNIETGTAIDFNYQEDYIFGGRVDKADIGVLFDINCNACAAYGTTVDSPKTAGFRLGPVTTSGGHSTDLGLYNAVVDGDVNSPIAAFDVGWVDGATLSGIYFEANQNGGTIWGNGVRLGAGGTSPNAITIQGGKFNGHVPSLIPDWSAAAFAAKAIIRPLTNNLAQCVYETLAGGTAAAAQPNWNTTCPEVGSTCTDGGGVIWTCIQSGAIEGVAASIIRGVTVIGNSIVDFPVAIDDSSSSSAVNWSAHNNNIYGSLATIWASGHGYTAGNVVMPTPRNQWVYQANGDCTSGGSQPVFPVTANGTVTDNTCTWQAVIDPLVGGSIFMQDGANVVSNSQITFAPYAINPVTITNAYLGVNRASAGQTIVQGQVTGDANARLLLLSNGAIQTGVGTTAAVTRIDASGNIIPPHVAIASCPAAGAPNEGATCVATDCNAGCVAGNACTTGGTTHCQMYSNGSAWVETGR